MTIFDRNLQILTLNRVFFEARNLKINCCFTIFGHFGIRKWKIIIWAVSRRRNRKIGPGIVWRSTWRPIHVHNYRYGTLRIKKLIFSKYKKFFKIQKIKKHRTRTRCKLVDEIRILTFWKLKVMISGLACFPRKNNWVGKLSLGKLSIESKFWNESKMFIYIFWSKINIMMLCHDGVNQAHFGFRIRSKNLNFLAFENSQKKTENLGFHYQRKFIWGYN